MSASQGVDEATSGDRISVGYVTAETVAIGKNINISISKGDEIFDVRGLADPYPGLQNYTYETSALYTNRKVVRIATK